MLSVWGKRLTHFSKYFFFTEHCIFFFLLLMFRAFSTPVNPLALDYARTPWPLSCLFLFCLPLSFQVHPDSALPVWGERCSFYQPLPHLWKCHLFWMICSCWVWHKMNLVRYYDPGLALDIYGWNLPLEENRNQAEFSKPCSETQGLGCGKWESRLEAAGNISDTDSSGKASAMHWCLGRLRRLRHLARFMSSLHSCF